MSEDLIYLDHNATTPLDPRVLEAMLPFLQGDFANAASRQHAAGRRAGAAVESAREQVAQLLGADPREIHWTSGATEANNLALFGVAASPAYTGRRHIVSARTEHRAVLDPCEELERRGFEVTWLRVDDAGHIDLQQLRESLRDDTLLVSLMHGNNEIGTLHPLAEIGALCRERGVLFHSDATQTVGKETLDLGSLPVDLLSLSAHKFCGPKGVGALYLRRRSPRVRCEPLLFGGGHERGLRSGTLNVPGIVGLGEAARLAASESAEDQQRIRNLRDDLERRLHEGCGARTNGPTDRRLAGTLNISLPGVEAEELLAAQPLLAASTASACTSAAVQPSYVLRALGLDDERVAGSLRLSLGRFTTRDEIERTASLLIAAATT